MARLRRALTHWRIIVRSNSAKAPATWKTSLRMGVVVTMACWSRYKSTPHASRCWIVSSKSLSERKAVIIISERCCPGNFWAGVGILAITSDDVMKQCEEAAVGHLDTEELRLLREVLDDPGFEKNLKER